MVALVMGNIGALIVSIKQHEYRLRELQSKKVHTVISYLISMISLYNKVVNSTLLITTSAHRQGYEIRVKV